MAPTLKLLIVCIAVMGGLAEAFFSRPTLPAGAELGDSCTPRFTARCGEKILLNQTEEPLTANDGYEGPNVCRITKMYMQQTYSYTYQEWCFGPNVCSVNCACTNACNGTMVNFTKTSIGCCDGFTQGEAESGATGESSYSFYFYRRRGRKSQLRTQGCPVMLTDNVLSCLVELELNEFLAEVLQVSDLTEMLGSADCDDVTIFAPSNNAITNLDDISRGRLFSDETREMTISAHIGDRSILGKKLHGGKLIDTLAGNVSLHVGQTRNNTVKQFYVNGVRISKLNACQARNGIVHIVDDVIPFSSATIDDFLTEDPRFTTFKQLVDAAGVNQPLAVPRKSRTLFAPTNEAFNQLPDGAVECLLREENKRHLSNLVCIHIAYPAEYTSTLSQRRHIPTFTFWSLLVTSENGMVKITRDEIPIEDAEIPARNGVIHVIPEVIVPSNIDFEELCPGMPTTTAMVTDAPTTEAVNVVDPETTSGPVVPGGTEDPETPGPDVISK